MSTGTILTFVLIGAFASWIAPHDYGATVGGSLQSPSSEFWFGTNVVGQDVFSRVIYGTQVSLGVAVPSILISLVLGLAVGLIAAYRRGWIDATLMRMMDVIFAFPAILLAVVLVAVLGPRLTNLVVVIAILFTPRFAVVIRAAAMSVRHQDYMTAARLMGARGLRINRTHVIPNILPFLIVEMGLSMSAAILTESALSFLGLGAQPPRPSWGGMVREAQSVMVLAPWTVIFPGIAIVLIVITFTVLSHELSQRLNLSGQVDR
ncbi:MAG: ABC transporter permease [Haloechinothrix sp.]